MSLPCYLSLFVSDNPNFWAIALEKLKDLEDKELHLIINDRGELLAFKLTSGNTDDRKPVHELAIVLLCPLKKLAIAM